MSIAFSQGKTFPRRIDVSTDAPIHWPSAVVGLVLAVAVVVGVSWLAQPRRIDARAVQGGVPVVAVQAVEEVAVAPTPIPQPALQPPVSAVERVRVTGTNGAGVNLRARPGERGARLKTVPEAATLELVGADEMADGMAWRNVRDAAGSAGWVAAKFLARSDR